MPNRTTDFYSRRPGKSPSSLSPRSSVRPFVCLSVGPRPFPLRHSRSATPTDRDLAAAEMFPLTRIRGGFLSRRIRAFRLIAGLVSHVRLKRYGQLSIGQLNAFPPKSSPLDPARPSRVNSSRRSCSKRSLRFENHHAFDDAFGFL